MNTMLLVRNLDNGRETVVRINDRGPFVRGRVIDLSYGMAKDLRVIGRGTARVELIALVEGKQPGKDTKVIAATAKKKVPDFNQGNFFIQIGAFAHKKNARLEAIRFSVRGRDVVIQQYATSGRNLYRVLVYGGNTLAKANQYREALDQAGYRDTLVIAR
jgi:rare lipoprotein A